MAGAFQVCERMLAQVNLASQHQRCARSGNRFSVPERRADDVIEGRAKCRFGHWRRFGAAQRSEGLAPIIGAGVRSHGSRVRALAVT
jgi:hypothetical protein